MKTSIYTALCILLLLTACKKSNSDTSTPAPLQAKLNGKAIKVNHLLTNPDIQYNGMKLLGMYGPIVGDTSNALSVTVAYEIVGKGESVDLATDGQGRAYITYQIGTSDIYGAGTGWASSSGKVTLTLNNAMQRRIV